jgi:hypothetical protein
MMLHYPTVTIHLTVKQGVADMPCIQFADELTALYPDARAVLTNRDPDKWLVSTTRTALEFFHWPSWKWIASSDPALAKPLYSIAILMLGLFVGRPGYDPAKYKEPEYRLLLRQAYLDHYAHVRAITPKNRSLKFRSEDGWEPLCEFLGIPVQKDPYPHINGTEDFVKLHKIFWWVAFRKFIAKQALPVVIAAGAFYSWQQRGSFTRYIHLLSIQQLGGFSIFKLRW